jgi:hypothetical protein
MTAWTAKGLFSVESGFSRIIAVNREEAVFRGVRLQPDNREGREECEEPEGS